MSHHTSAKILLSVRLIKINQKVSACQSKKQFDLNVVENSLERKNETKNNIKRKHNHKLRYGIAVNKITVIVISTLNILLIRNDIIIQAGCGKRRNSVKE